MGSKTLVAAASLVLCFFSPAMLSAQTDHDAKQDAQIVQLRKDLASLTDAVAKQGEQVKKLQSDFSTALQAIRDQSAQTEALFKKSDSLIQAVRDQSAQHQEILNAISGTDRSGNTVLKLLPIMKQSPQFRQEVSDAVHETMRQQGTVRVRNEMGTSNTLLVNGQQYSIAPYSTVEISVPVGTLTTELPGYEAPKNWTIGPPNYTQSIDIRPKYNPVVVVEPPRFVYPPLVVGGSDWYPY